MNHRGTEALREPPAERGVDATTLTIHARPADVVRWFRAHGRPLASYLSAHFDGRMTIQVAAALASEGRSGAGLSEIPKLQAGASRPCTVTAKMAVPQQMIPVHGDFDLVSAAWPLAKCKWR